MTKGENVLCSPFAYLKGGLNMTKEEFALWAADMYNRFNSEKRLAHSLDSAKGICVVYTTDTYESAVSKYDKDKVSIAIATTYAKLKGIEIPTIEETPIPWKAKRGERYYFVGTNGRISSYPNDNDFTDDCCYEFGNYFKTREQAESARKKIKHLLKLQRLHDMLCPDYEPDWSSDGEMKWFIICEEYDHNYYPRNSYVYDNRETVYFTKEAAEKACKILNKEKEK